MGPFGSLDGFGRRDVKLLLLSLLLAVLVVAVVGVEIGVQNGGEREVGRRRVDDRNESAN